MPRSTLVLAVAVVLAFATSLHAAKIVLIADAENNLIRRYVPPTGKILHVAGTGKKGAAGLDGPPDQAELTRPTASPSTAMAPSTSPTATTTAF